MAEFFNKYTPDYIKAIKKHNNKYKIKLEVLGYFENVIGEIVKDLSVTAQGQININYQPIARRSCSLTLINVDKKYIPSPNNTFWFERKFQLWIGIVDRSNNIYWWSQGVFFTQSANSDGNTVNIEAIDKGGALNGALGMNIIDTQYVVPSGTSISKLVKDTLMLNITDMPSDKPNGTSKPIDPLTPIIDIKYNNLFTQSEISIDAGNSIGEIFEAIGEGYNADLYYDIHGHFQVAELATGSRVEGYKYMAYQWNYDDNDSFYGLANFEYNFNGKNAVTVYTNASNIENVSYTAYNRNPVSPIRTANVGIRRMDSKEIGYANVTESDMLKKCKQYAEYLLIQEALRGASVTFNSPIIPHLDVNRTISITDKLQNFDREIFVIQSITIPLSSEMMSISATSINWLPNDLAMG